MTPLDSMLAAFGKRDDISSGGKQMPSHFSKKKKEFYLKVHQLLQILHAVGAALALKWTVNKILQ